MMGKECYLLGCIGQQRDDGSVQNLMGTSNSSTSSLEYEHNFILNDFDSGPETEIGPKEIDFFLDNGSVRKIVVEENLRAVDLCHVLALKINVCESGSWTLMEQITDLGIERFIEDHEEVLRIYASWKTDSTSCQNKFIFRQDFRKYEFFNNPGKIFPFELLKLKPSAYNTLAESKFVADIAALQNILNEGEMPTVSDYIWCQESENDWKKMFFNINSYNLNYGASPESKFILFKDLRVHDICYPIEESNETTMKFKFCLKSSTGDGVPTSLSWFYVESEKLKQCWIATLRLAKYGSKIRSNYEENVTRFSLEPRNSSNYRPISSALVAMDFSGKYGRVIENEKEVAVIAATEGHMWRRKITSIQTSPSSAQNFSQSPISKAPFEFGVHTLQPWFHSDMSRSEAIRKLKRYGTVDGVFVVRESNRHLGNFVLDYSYKDNIHHAEIIPFEEKSHLCYSLDHGKTKFYDLISLVEFYQLNLGSLPTKLTHFLAHEPKSKDLPK